MKAKLIQCLAMTRVSKDFRELPRNFQKQLGEGGKVYLSSAQLTAVSFSIQVSPGLGNPRHGVECA